MYASRPNEYILLLNICKVNMQFDMASIYGMYLIHL